MRSGARRKRCGELADPNMRHALLIFPFLVSSALAADLPKVANYTTTDLAGNAVGNDAWRDKRAIVIVFLGTECPVSNGYAPEFERLYQRFRGQNVAWVGVHCAPDVSVDAAKEHAREYGLTFPLALDHEQLLARKTGVKTMPTGVVLSPDGQIVYRGRIDNRYDTSGKRRPEATTHELADAIAATLEGKAPAVVETKAFGCPLPPTRERKSQAR
jgi:peroxiredoxin